MSQSLLAIQNILQNSNIFNRSRETVLFTPFGDKKVTQFSGFLPTSVSYLNSIKIILPMRFQLLCRRIAFNYFQIAHWWSNAYKCNRSAAVCLLGKTGVSNLHQFSKTLQLQWQFCKSFDNLRLLAHVEISVKCHFKGYSILSFSAVITFSTFFAFIVKST